MRKKVRTLTPQSSFLDAVDRTEYGEDSIPKPAEAKETKVVTKYLTFPKIVTNSLKCPDCGLAVVLRPDGSMVCPKCVVRMPYGEAEC